MKTFGELTYDDAMYSITSDGVVRKHIIYGIQDYQFANEFRKEASNYGFIERYSKGKEHITGIAHEPWHFRYVGCPHSKIMSETSMTLEEYLLFVKRFSQEKPYVWSDEEGYIAEIFYVGAETMDISMLDDCICQISGNNMDGFVVTLWRCCDEQA